MKKENKNGGFISKIVVGVIALAVIFIGGSFLHYNTRNQSVLIMQFGEIVDSVDEPGIYITIPVLQTTKEIYTGERLYDIAASEVITSDKKTMIADCYVTWQITDPISYYQNLSSESVAQSRIDTAVYKSMKNVISSTTQDDVIGGKDGSLGTNILNRISSLAGYGITITEVEMKALDLPEDNKAAVYERMISERQVIAAEYKATGEKNASNIRSQTDAQVRTIISEAEVIAANTMAEGESLYFKTLADAYSSSSERTEFYNYIVGLEAMKTTLSEGGLITIDENSPLYSILINEGIEQEETIEQMETAE